MFVFEELRARCERHVQKERVKRREVWKNEINYAWKLQTMLRLTHFVTPARMSLRFVKRNNFTQLDSNNFAHEAFFSVVVDLMRWMFRSNRAHDGQLKFRKCEILLIEFLSLYLSHLKRFKTSDNHETQPRSNQSRWGKWIKRRSFASTAVSWEFSGKLAWLS